MAGDDRMRELEERYEGYTVYDSSGEKVGKVDDLFVDETDREEYIGVKMGLFGLSGTTLIPMELVRVNERERAIEVSETKEHVKDAPNYRDDDEVNADFEDRIRAHFGMEGAQPTGERGSYGRSAGDAAGGGAVGGGAAASGAAARAQSPQDDMRRGDRDPDDRYSGAMGGVQDRDPIGQDRIDQDRMDQERIGRDRDPADRYSDAAMGGAEDRNRAGRESYRNREEMGSESAMGSAGAGGASASGGISDLETGERGRTTDRGDLDRGSIDRGDLDRGAMDREDREPGRPGDREGADVGGMTRGHREGGDRDDSGSSGQGMLRGDEGVQGHPGDEEAYRQGYQEGLREGLREAGLEETGGRGGGGHRDLGSSGSMRGSESAEGGMSRGGADEYGGVGEEGMTGERGARETSADRGQEGTQDEEGAATRVWRRIRG